MYFVDEQNKECYDEKEKNDSTIASVNYANNQQLNTGESSSSDSGISQFFTMETRSYEEVLTTDPETITPKPRVQSVPDEFSWLNHQGKDWTTSVKRQECGDCWLFASIGCLESMINIKEDFANLNPDLSEQYVLSCLPNSGSCRGGWPHRSFQYMMDDSTQGNNHNGALLESCFHYVGIDANGCDYSDCNNDPVLCSEKCSEWTDHLIPIKSYDRWSPDGSQTDIDRIKSEIYNKGPVCTSFLANDEFSEWVSTHHDENDYFPYSGYVDDINHCVVLVGWKDDPSIGNGGYWIVKNSWGPYSGYDGYFNIEYGALGIDNVQIVSVDYDPSSIDWAPIADTGGVYHGSIGDSITFDASESGDAERNIVSYHWDFGDGTTSSNCVESHTYDQRGLYQVKLTVIDESGNVGMQETNALIDFWEKDDSWTYDIDIDFEFTDLVTGYMDFEINDFTLTVVDVTDEEYFVEFNGDLTGEFDTLVYTFNIGGHTPRSIPLKGSLVLNKETLHINQITLDTKGRISLGKTPSSLIGLPIPFSLATEINVGEGFEMIHLPIKEYISMDLSASNVQIDGEFSSFWLRMIHVMNSLSGGSLLPDEIGDLLPVIDLYDLVQDIEILTYPYTCSYHGMVDVAAGQFDSYKMSVKTSYSDAFQSDYYFSPEISNIVIANAELQELDFSFMKISGNVKAELQSYNYQ